MRFDRARCRRRDAGNNFEKRRLPAAVWADDTDPLPFLNREINIFERPELFVFSVGQSLHERGLLVMDCVAFGDIREPDGEIA